jgi:hypothetical protein
MAREKFYEVPRILPNGVAIFPKKGLDPPPEMEGYQRRSPNLKSTDAWSFIPLWQPCSARSQKFVQRDSGCPCVKIVMYCHYKPDESLTLQNCLKCHEQQSLIESSSSNSVSEGVVVAEEGDSEPVTESAQSEAGKGDSIASKDSPIIDTQG